jgi:hypothetical protein
MPNRTEEFTVDGKDLLKKVKTLIAESNVRRIIIKNKQAKTIIEIPLAVGVVCWRQCWRLWEQSPL